MGIAVAVLLFSSCLMPWLSAMAFAESMFVNLCRLP